MSGRGGKFKTKKVVKHKWATDASRGDLETIVTQQQSKQKHAGAKKAKMGKDRNNVLNQNVDKDNQGTNNNATVSTSGGTGAKVNTLPWDGRTRAASKSVVNAEPLPPFEQSIADQMEEIDRQFANHGGDHVDLVVDEVEEAQFPSQSKGEENSEEEQYEDEDEGNDPQRDSENELSETSFDGSEVTFRRPMQVVESEQFEHLRGNLAFESYIKKMVASELKSVANTPKEKTPERQHQGSGHRGKELIKSPSDTTLYTPALRQVNSPLRQGNGTVVRQLNPVPVIKEVEVPQSAHAQQDDDLANTIIKFIQGVRVQHEERRLSKETRIEREAEEARWKSEEAIVHAERFKAVVNQPPGELAIHSQVNQNLDVVGPVGGVGQERLSGPTGDGDVDDQFFHVTCHIDETLRQKIEKGEFVELDRLLHKVSNKVNEQRLDLIYKDRHSYFVPSAPDNKVNGIKKWEQAFRIYAAIYSQANPLRAAEIWQYVYIINTAASVYI